MLIVEGAQSNRREFFQFLAASAVLTPAARAQQIAPPISVQDMRSR